MSYRFLTLTVLGAMMTMGALAQEKLLSVQETTDGIGVYPCGDRHEALVQFVTSEPFALEFESTHDAELNIAVDSIAGKKTYSIVFVTQSPGMDYSGRRVTIMAPGFEHYRLPLPLRDKQKFEYTVSDPYSALRSPFFVYLEKAQNAFQDGNYQTAKDNYELCRYCPEYQNDTSLILEHIVICDSMMTWNDEALQNHHFSKFKAEAESYQKMLRYNPNPQLYSNLYAAQNQFNDDCAALARMGESHLNRGELEKAESMYRQIAENGCTEFSEVASQALSQIHRARQRRDDHARTVMLMYQSNMYGISWGNYYTSRSHGWYGTVMFNFEDFNLLAQRSHVEGKLSMPSTWDKNTNLTIDDITDQATFQYDKMKKDEGKNKGNYYPKNGKFDYEASLSVGCSWHIWEPIFVTFGLGYHGGGFSTFDEGNFLSALNKVKKDKDFDLQNDNTWDSGFRYDYSKVNWFHAAAPELGIVLKYWRAAIKVSYQYSYWINTGDYEDFLKDNAHAVSFGVGFCW